MLKGTCGWAHSETLVVLRELILMNMRLKGAESHTTVLHLLVTSTVEILQTEKHSKVLCDAAKIIGGLFVDCNLAEHGFEILRELRLQIITKTYTSESKHAFKIDKSVGRASYVFLATFEMVLRGSPAISYSEIMTELLIETTLYEHYVRCRNTETNLEMTLTHAARLHRFLTLRGRVQQKQVLEHETFELFIKKWGSSLKSSRNISMAFFIHLLEHLGDESHRTNLQSAACRGSVEAVRDLLESERFQDGYETALCAFRFIETLRAYHDLHNIGYGFKLSSYMAFRDLERGVSEKGIDQKLRDQMLELSRTIIRDVLKACKESSISFVRLKLGELNELVGLLGQQKNYVDLEVCFHLDLYCL